MAIIREWVPVRPPDLWIGHLPPKLRQFVVIRVADLSQNKDGRPPRFVDSRFAEDGSPLPYAGLTFVSSPSAGSVISNWLAEFIEKLRAVQGACVFAWLPLSSLHLTLFDGACDRRRRPELWPSDVALDMSMRQLRDIYRARTELLAAPAMTGLEFCGLESGPNGGGLVLLLKPAGLNMPVMRQYRDRLADALGIRAPDHDSYRFHVTIAYLVRWMDAERATSFAAAAESLYANMVGRLGPFDLAPARLCAFEDMTRFVPIHPETAKQD